MGLIPDPGDNFALCPNGLLIHDRQHDLICFQPLQRAKINEGRLLVSSKFLDLFLIFLFTAFPSASNRRSVKLLPYANWRPELGSIDGTRDVLLLPIRHHRRPNSASSLFRIKTPNRFPAHCAKAEQKGPTQPNRQRPGFIADAATTTKRRATRTGASRQLPRRFGRGVCFTNGQWGEWWRGLCCRIRTKIKQDFFEKKHNLYEMMTPVLLREKKRILQFVSDYLSFLHTRTHTTPNSNPTSFFSFALILYSSFLTHWHFCNTQTQT